MVRDGEIRRIEAIMIRSAYGMNSGWSSWEDGMSDRQQDVSNGLISEDGQ